MGQVLIVGCIAGGIYALFAISVVLVYRGTGVLTFAQGEIGAASLYLAAYLVTDQKLPWFVGALAALLLAGVLGVAFERLVVRPMVDADKVAIAVATVGLVLFLVAVEFNLFGQSPRSLKGPFTGGVRVDRIVISATQIIALLLAVALGFGLQAALRRSDFGLGILAAAQDPAAVRLVGVPLSRISATLWGAGAVVSAIAALLVEPTVTVFSPGYASELYVVGLAAACVGGLTSLPGAVVGGLVLGIAESAANRYLGDSGLSGLRYVTVFAVLLVVLLGRSVWPDLRRRLAQRSAADPALPLAGRAG